MRPGAGNATPVGICRDPNMILRSRNATPVGIGQSLPDVSGALPGRFEFPMRLREPSPKHPSTLADGNFSLGSAAVGAALSNVYFGRPPVAGDRKSEIVLALGRELKLVHWDVSWQQIFG